jgi:hypothetical protein
MVPDALVELSLEERKFEFDKEVRLQEIALRARETAIKETEFKPI